jgi:hypothetical protein
VRPSHLEANVDPVVRVRRTEVRFSGEASTSTGFVLKAEGIAEDVLERVGQALPDCRALRLRTGSRLDRLVLSLGQTVDGPGERDRVQLSTQILTKRSQVRDLQAKGEMLQLFPVRGQGPQSRVEEVSKHVGAE